MFSRYDTTWYQCDIHVTYRHLTLKKNSPHKYYKFQNSLFLSLCRQIIPADHAWNVLHVYLWPELQDQNLCEIHWSGVSFWQVKSTPTPGTLNWTSGSKPVCNPLIWGQSLCLWQVQSTPTTGTLTELQRSHWELVWQLQPILKFLQP